jgi:very-short-patch-repair endonuclease
VIEVDGAYHFQDDPSDYDQGRSYELKELGIKVLRFTNEEVIADINAVIKTISMHLPLNPSPGRGTLKFRPPSPGGEGLGMR